MGTKAISDNPRLKEKLSQKGESHNDFLTWTQITKQNHQFSAIHIKKLLEEKPLWREILVFTVS